MKTNNTPEYSAIKAERARNGLYYGILAALAFSLVAWGYDAVLLSRANGGLPWLKLAIGGGITLMVGAFVGWLTAKLDSTLVGLGGWLLSGIVFGWIASHLPFDITALALRIINHPVHEIVTYTYPENLWRRMVIVYGILLIAAALVGILETNLVESASTAYSSLMRWLLLAVCIPLFAIAGSVVDGYINQPMREPIQAIHELIQNGIQNEITPFEPRQVAQMRLRALNPITDQLHKPYLLYIGSYDPVYLDTFNVLIDFNGAWAECRVLINSPSHCMPMAEGAASNPPAPVGQVPSSNPPAPTSQATLNNLPATEPAQETAAPVNLDTQAGTASPMLQQALPPVVQNAPHYTITLDINYAEHSFTGLAQLAYTNTENTSLNQLYFRLIPNGKGSYGDGSLSVSKTLVDDQPVETQLSLNDTVLEVSLPQPLEPGMSAQIDFDYTGQVPVDFGSGPNASGYGIYNYSDGVLALSAWYPMLAVYDDQGWNLDPVSYIGDSVFSDIAFYSVDVSAPSNLVVATTGVSTHQEASDGTTRYHFESGAARDFFLIMSPSFQVKSETVDGTTVNSYYLPSHARGGESALKVATNSLQIFNQEFGPYPYTEFDVVEAPMQNASGVEFPGIVLIAGSLYEEPEGSYFVVTTAHEVAHQWWYNVIGNDVFDDPWMDESLTSYSSSLYYEFQQGSRAVRGLIAYWEDRYKQAQQEGKDDRITQSLAHFESLGDPSVYSYVVYSKGALFFVALRDEIGDQAFFKALQDYYNTYQYQIATPDELLNVFEEASGQQLEDFYRQWLSTPGS